MRPFRLIKHSKTFQKIEMKKFFFKKILITKIFLNKVNLLTESNVDSQSINWFLVNYLTFFYRFGNIGRHKNLCFLTNKSRSVFRRFRIARIAFRELGVFSKLTGLKKASW